MKQLISITLLVWHKGLLTPPGRDDHVGPALPPGRNDKLVHMPLGAKVLGVTTSGSDGSQRLILELLADRAAPPVEVRVVLLHGRHRSEEQDDGSGLEALTHAGGGTIGGARFHVWYDADVLVGAGDGVVGSSVARPDETRPTAGGLIDVDHVTARDNSTTDLLIAHVKAVQEVLGLANGLTAPDPAETVAAIRALQEQDLLLRKVKDIVARPPTYEAGDARGCVIIVIELRELLLPGV